MLHQHCPKILDSILDMMCGNDAILLLNDACYLSTQNTLKKDIVNKRIYVLEQDIHQRQIVNKLADHVTPISAETWVELTTTHTQIVSW